MSNPRRRAAIDAQPLDEGALAGHAERCTDAPGLAAAAHPGAAEDPWLPIREAITARLAVLGLTQRQASLQAGLSPDCVKEIVAGRRRPRPDTLKRIGRVLGCDFVD